MNAYSKFMDISMQALPEPLTNADQSGFQWCKFAHIEYLLDPEVSALSLEAQGAFLRLMSYAAIEVPFGSLPDDIQHLIKMVGFKLPDQNNKAFIKAYQHAQSVVKAVLDAAFILCGDERYYMPLLTNQLTHDVKSNESTTTGQDNTKTSPTVRKRSSSTERMARKRDRERLLKEQLLKEQQNNSDASHVTPQSVTCDGSDAKCDAVTDSVTLKASHVTGSSVTNGGIKGGDLDLDSDLDSKKNKNNLASDAKIDPDYFETPDLGWTPRLGLINTRLKMAGQQQITQDFLLQTLVTFNPHFDDAPVMSDNKRLGKLVNWIGNKQQKAAAKVVKPTSSVKFDPNNSYYGISKEDIKKYARPGETEFDCAKRLADESKQGGETQSYNEKKTVVPTAGVWSMGNKHALKQIQQLDSSMTIECIDAMAKQQGKDIDLVLATLYHQLASKAKEQDIAATRNKECANGLV